VSGNWHSYRNKVIDWFLELSKGLRQKLQTEIYRMEERQTMKYVTSFERDAKEEGIVIGKELGVVEGIEIGRIEVARKLMANGFSAEQAASIADVSVGLLQLS
jgi:predicted transposase YdaD